MKLSIVTLAFSFLAAGCFAMPDRPDTTPAPSAEQPPPAPPASAAEGTPGPAGPSGAEGAPGSVSRGDTYTVIGEWRKFGPGEIQSSSATCERAADMLVTGGCLVAANGGEASIVTSAPLIPQNADEPAYWSCTAKNVGENPAEVVATAVCARGK